MPNIQFRELREDEKVLVEIDVFRCCTVDGEYWGGTFIHDPELPGDGPWLVRITKLDVSITFGAGTKEDALRIVNSMSRFAEERYDIDISDDED